MPDISEAVVFPKDLEIIDNKIQQLTFSYKSWNDEDLEPVRSFLRKSYRTKQLGRCAYCRQTVSFTSALNCHVEHIVPKSIHIDFIFTPRNLCVICADCNQIKRNQETLNEIPDTIDAKFIRKSYPNSSSGFKIVHPHFDKYSEHIKIVNGYYLDKSPKGNFTIGACKLNRKLYEFGWEPDIVDKTEVFELMSDYIDEGDSIRQNSILTTLKDILFFL